jgi:hypothetical protein
MQPKPVENTGQLKTEWRLPWHKPQVKRLQITLDTTGPKAGSNSDGLNQPTP